MLSLLRIRNFALVDSLEWEVPAGFVGITGETGAGKSILIGAFKLLIGERADKSMIRSGAEECVIEALIQLPQASAIPALLEEAGVEPCEDGQLLLKRVISVSGGGRQFVNGSACTLSVIRQIGESLVDLHGPHDHQSLFSRDAQTQLLDAFAGSVDLVAAYRRHRAKLLALEAEQAAVEADAQALERELDLLRHQVGEIDGAELLPNEEEPLLAKQIAGANAERLGLLAAEAAQALIGGDDSLESVSLEIGRTLREMSRLDDRATPFLERAALLTEEINDLGRKVEAYREGIDSDPESLAAIEARLDLIESLKRKYGRTIAEVLEFADQAREKLKTLETRIERRSNLDGEIAQARSDMLAEGEKLTALRMEAAPRLAAEVREHLADLGFLEAGFEIRLDEVAAPGADGLETVEFVFAPNPGEPPQPLRSIASSGEISRVMLALKTSLASQDAVPILVFDEIDANVGGEIAHAVARKMREISTERQVLCITHLPQVAATANAHFVVSKAVVDGRTLSLLREVLDTERTDEIARMLGDRAGQAAQAHARELLSGEEKAASAKRRKTSRTAS